VPRSRHDRSTRWVCQQCGYESPGFYGRCPSCGAWNSLVETVIVDRPSSSSGRHRTSVHAVPLAQVTSAGERRLPIGLGEFDRVLGGGLVPGALILLGGDPGIGKSTLLLQAAGNVANRIGSVLYIAAEESAEQVKLRADRIGVDADQLYLLPETSLTAALDVAQALKPRVVIVDSIQTVFVEELASSPGTVSQVRECTARLMRYAKEAHVPVFLVGHVTKEGVIAGPRVVEHMVDAVLYLEGERFHQYRVLRAVKNRFGSTDEVGVFEMADHGLQEVGNPSGVFLEQRLHDAPGSAVIVTLEGTRPILIEVQALTSPVGYAMPRRTATGFDLNRLQLLVAVLQKRLGYRLGHHDIFVNVTGGLRVVEPAADLGVAVAIASSFTERPVRDDTVLIGEIGLSGELRSVSGLDRRLQEAASLGFQRAVIPPLSERNQVLTNRLPLTVISARTVAEAITLSLAEASPTVSLQDDVEAEA